MGTSNLVELGAANAILVDRERVMCARSWLLFSFDSSNNNTVFLHSFPAPSSCGPATHSASISESSCDISLYPVVAEAVERKLSPNMLPGQGSLQRFEGFYVFGSASFFLLCASMILQALVLDSVPLLIAFARLDTIQYRENDGAGSLGAHCVR